MDDDPSIFSQMDKYSKLTLASPFIYIFLSKEELSL